MDYENFYQSLRYHVEKKGHGGQALVCRHTGIPKSYLSRIMKKDRQAGGGTQRKIAEFFGFALAEFAELGRRISMGEDPERSVDLIQALPGEQLIQRLTEAVRKEIVTSRELDRTQLLYEDIVENSRQMIVRFNRNHRITFCNRAAEQLSGMDRQRLADLEWTLLFAAAWHNSLAQKARARQGAGGSFSLELPVSSGKIWLFLTVTIFPAGEGRPDLGQLVGFDITDKKNMADRLYYIQHGVEMSFVPTLVIADSANLLYVNQAVCSLLGYSREELLTMSVWDINPLITRENWREKWAWFEAEEKVFFAGQYRHKSGAIISVEFRVCNLKYPDGRRYNVVYVQPEAGEAF